jgi:hypothetical protein
MLFRESITGEILAFAFALDVKVLGEGGSPIIHSTIPVKV